MHSGRAEMDATRRCPVKKRTHVPNVSKGFITVGVTPWYIIASQHSSDPTIRNMSNSHWQYDYDPLGYDDFMSGSFDQNNLSLASHDNSGGEFGDGLAQLSQTVSRQPVPYLYALTNYCSPRQSHLCSLSPFRFYGLSLSLSLSRLSNHTIAL